MILNVNASLLNYLINGDDQGLSDREKNLCDDILEEFEYPIISLGPDSEPYFSMCDITSVRGNCYELEIISFNNFF